MIRKSDVKWWLLEARKHPESAIKIIEELVRRLEELDRLNEQLRDRIVRLQHRPQPTETGSAQIQNLKRQVELMRSMVDGQSTSENAILFLSEKLETARTSVSRIKQLAHQRQKVFNQEALFSLHTLLAARPHDEIIMLTSLGSMHKMLTPDVPHLIDEEQWTESSPLPLESGELLTAATVTQELPRFWTVVTRRGYVQRHVRVAIERQLAAGQKLPPSPFHNDPPIALVKGERGDVMLLTRWGHAVRFPQHTIEVHGSKATEFDQDDRVIGAVDLEKDLDVLILTASGFAAKYPTQRLRRLAKPGAKSTRIFLARDVSKILSCPPQSRLLCISYSGRISMFPTSDLPVLERAGKGQQLANSRRDPILSATLIPEDWL